MPEEDALRNMRDQRTGRSAPDVTGVGHNFIGHNYLGHGHIGHDYMGHDYMGHATKWAMAI